MNWFSRSSEEAAFWGVTAGVLGVSPPPKRFRGWCGDLRRRDSSWRGSLVSWPWSHGVALVALLILSAGCGEAHCMAQVALLMLSAACLHHASAAAACLAAACCAQKQPS